jgi:hypothetical protein
VPGLASLANMVFEQLVNSSVLDVVVPDTSLEFPSSPVADEWLERLKSTSLERNQAFFGVLLYVLNSDVLYQHLTRRETSVPPDRPYRPP